MSEIWADEREKQIVGEVDEGGDEMRGPFLFKMVMCGCVIFAAASLFVVVWLW